MRKAAVAGAAVFAFSVASAEAHQCYRRVVDPPRYSTVEEQVLVSPEREVAEYVPAETRQVEETVVLRPERTITQVVPPQYGYEEQTVEVAPAHREWRTRDEDGEVIGCWVSVPPRYARVARRVLLSPAREVSQTIPEETATRLRTEIVEPAHTVAHTIPARYATRERAVLESPGGAHWAPLDDCER
jgi:hypothetical protein